MATLEELERRIIAILGDDPDEDWSYTEELLRDAVGAGLDAILTRTFKTATATISGDVSSYALPSDLFEVQAVWDETKDMFLDQAILAPGEPGASISGNGWYTYPNGYITFYTALGSDGGTLLYSATWTKPTLSSDVIEAPSFCHTAIVLYGASYAVLQPAASAAKLGAYKSRIDSGRPTDNPLTEYASFLRDLFYQELDRMPLIEKGRK